MSNYVFESKIVKTRKEHFCDGCANKYRKDIRMWMVKQVYDGLFFYSHFCLNCNEVLEKIGFEIEFSTGDLKQDWDMLDQNYNLEYEKEEVSGG